MAHGPDPLHTGALSLHCGAERPLPARLDRTGPKSLVLDADNVLWGGILGEDGISGIRVGPEHPGSAFQDFQSALLDLRARGAILALCSKNNMDDLLEVLRPHQGMLLREEHISAMRVNWRDKASNIRELAAELNIGLDSMVFLDDSEFEAELVRSLLPEVTVIRPQPERPTAYREVLSACGLFDTLTLSAEDRRRGQMYREEAAWRSLKASQPDLEGYLASLEMELRLEWGSEATLGRVASNQMHIIS